MNPEAIKVLKEIFKKEARELTENDIAFLKARWTYIGARSREKYKDTVFAKKGRNQKEVKAPVAKPVEEVETNSFPPAEVVDDGDEEEADGTIEADNDIEEKTSEIIDEE